MSGPTTAAQEEFNDFIAKNSRNDDYRVHPEDRSSTAQDSEDQDEEDEYRASQIDAAMRMPTLDGHRSQSGGAVKLPPASFDSGRATGVKGVIADARSYETARKSKWKTRVTAVRRSMFGMPTASVDTSSPADSGDSEADNTDEETFLQQWRESRRRELEAETNGIPPQRTQRRTSPSARIFGRLDEVDALGYLDAIEKVGREVTVVVFVYDHQCEASGVVEAALLPLVRASPAVHFVKVHYEDIEFDNAAVPAILGYRNQGDLFANLTGIIEMIPEDDDFDSDSLRRIFRKHGIL